jgi:cell division protein FtsZ
LDLDEDLGIDSLNINTKSTPSMAVVEPTKPSQLDLIPTTELIKDINIVYDEVSLNAEDLNDFVITSESDTVVSEPFVEEREEQITLTFDMPFNEPVDFVEKEEALAETLPIQESPEPVAENIQPTIHQLTEEEKQIIVKDEIEIIPISETTNTGEIRYALDDYELEESALNKKISDPEAEVVEDFDIVLKQEEDTVEVVKSPKISEEEIDPLNTPISELLRSRADERRKKMKLFNYKFNNSKIDDIEKVPAYKRQGLELEDGQHSSENNNSRTKLSLDDNNDIQLRNNNSFLHDNVD